MSGEFWKSVRDSVRRWHCDTRAAANIEYSVIGVLVLVACLVGLGYLGEVISDAFSGMEHSIAVAEHLTDEHEPEKVAKTKRSASVVRHAENAVATTRIVVLTLCVFLFTMIVIRLRQKSIEKEANEALRQQIDEIPADVIFQKRHAILTELFDDVTSLYHLQIKIGQVMTRQIKTVAPNESISELKKIVFEQKKRHLLVVGKSGELLGVISDRDLLGREGTTAASLMTKDPLTVDQSSLLDPAVTLMVRHRISCLPVLDNGKLCGLLTSTDVMMALQCTSQAIQRLSEDQLEKRRFETNELSELEQELETEMAAGT